MQRNPMMYHAKPISRVGSLRFAAMRHANENDLSMLKHAFGGRPGVGVGVDVLVMSREEFTRRSQVPGTLPYWVAKEGRLIHDASA